MLDSRAFIRLFVACAVLGAFSCPEARALPEAELELGQQFGFGFDHSKVTRKRFYLGAKAEHTWDLSSEKNPDAGSIAITGAMRAWGDVESEVDLRALSAVWNRTTFRAELGFQEIAWGETFGFFIADIVNPRDFRDPLFNEPGWTRLSVFALNAQAFLDKLTLQVVLTPAPRLNRLPETVSGRNVPAFGDFRLSPEFGGRASYLFESGLDLGFLYFHHWNRNPALLAAVGPDGAPFVGQVEERVDTFGMTASQAFNEWVFRLDSVVHVNQPLLFSLGTPATKTNTQLIVGADRSTEGEGSSSGRFGFQYHLDSQNEVQHWASMMVQTSWAERKWEAELFVFKGLDNRDLWIQPKLTWYFGDAFSWSARVDFLAGAEASAGSATPEGALSSLARDDRFLSWMTYRF